MRAFWARKFEIWALWYYLINIFSHSPELVAKLNKLEAEQENAEYNNECSS